MVGKKNLDGAKKRKTPNGPLRNKERSRKKLIDAVGKVFTKEGHASLNAVKIAQAANLDRKLIYLYFGSLDNLIDCYFKQNDFWTPEYNKEIARWLNRREPLNQQEILHILTEQLDNVLNNKAFQKCIQWEISENNKHMTKIAEEREQVGEVLLNYTEKSFTESGLDLRAMLALQIAGIYYLGLHARVNGSTFCGIDINLKEGKIRIENALREVLDNIYGKAKTQNQK